MAHAVQFGLNVDPNADGLAIAERITGGRVGCAAPQADRYLKKWVRACGSRRPSTSMSIFSL
jgi:hypothetical protein